jgi:hypothetical protein
MNRFPFRNRYKPSESENHGKYCCDPCCDLCEQLERAWMPADRLSTSSSARMNTLMSLSEFQLLTSIHSRSSFSLIDDLPLLGMFFQVMFIDSTFCSFIRIYRSRCHACKKRDQSVKPLQTTSNDFLCVWRAGPTETQIPARGPTRHSNCSRHS